MFVFVDETGSVQTDFKKEINEFRLKNNSYKFKEQTFFLLTSIIVSQKEMNSLSKMWLEEKELLFSDSKNISFHTTDFFNRKEKYKNINHDKLKNFISNTFDKLSKQKFKICSISINKDEWIKKIPNPENPYLFSLEYLSKIFKDSIFSNLKIFFESHKDHYYYFKKIHNQESFIDIKTKKINKINTLTKIGLGEYTNLLEITDFISFWLWKFRLYIFEKTIKKSYNIVNINDKWIKIFLSDKQFNIPLLGKEKNSIILFPK